MTQIAEQGRLADEKLQALGLCLTQGGEPTFVPHDTRLPEWNYAALGTEKLLYARRLAASLLQRLYPGAVVLQSFGKQFPGEPLPRWQLGLYRSRSGKPAWKDPGRLQLAGAPDPPAKPDHGLLLIRRVATALHVSRTGILPAHEDFEAFLRANPDPECQQVIPRFSAKRRRFLKPAIPKEFWESREARLKPAGWVLPLDFQDPDWRSEPWLLPEGKEVTLLPGDSPIGLRLPLNRLPEGTCTRAMTVECRDGELIVFLPPLPSASTFLELVRIIERIAARNSLPPLRLEGYPPARDADLESITFMSDPGVIEVNLPPAQAWSELERVVRGLYDSAEACGLRGCKLQMNGRVVGAGGGAHIILGGPDLDRNPFIQRPHILSSLLRFVQNHPCLSYLFTGLFIGPSSQAPRVDESAYEMPYELEIALRALESSTCPGDPNLIDAMLRNLLMDWNGNTHRAEISVDKFYNQNAPNGRLGLIEFRAFEMVPSADLHLAAHLLLRALAAGFAEEPYTKPLRAWQGALHDRYSLPSFLMEDVREVLRHLQTHGFDIPERFYQDQLNFRFPILHRFELAGTHWTLRQAVEPWPVMGDHTGTGRTVDATTDRLELWAEDATAAATMRASVNGYRLPLRQAENLPHAVCGIRYRLFDNLWGLQPQIRAHTPLQFELADAESGTIVHAFDYLNWKREGGYEALPKSFEEAKERVEERLVPRPDKTGQQSSWKEVSLPPGARYILDLRCVP